MHVFACLHMCYTSLYTSSKSSILQVSYCSNVNLCTSLPLYCKHKTRGVSTRKDYFNPCINWRFSIIFSLSLLVAYNHDISKSLDSVYTEISVVYLSIPSVMQDIVGQVWARHMQLLQAYDSHHTRYMYIHNTGTELTGADTHMVCTRLMIWTCRKLP